MREKKSMHSLSGPFLSVASGTNSFQGNLLGALARGTSLYSSLVSTSFVKGALDSEAGSLV
jgi:hypothetical protein